MDQYEKVRHIQKSRREKAKKFPNKKCIIRNCGLYVAHQHAGYDDSICSNCWRKRFKLKSSPFYVDLKAKQVEVDKLKAEINECIKSCQKATKGFSPTDHVRIDLEGKIYAYEFVRDVLLEGKS